MNSAAFQPRCCIIGGGPAGVMLGYLLARWGIRVTVLEKHGDFFRDFRGDTMHPSTLDVLDELGLLKEFLQLPHQKITSINGTFGDFTFQAADTSHLPTRCRYIALVPQWDFLQFLSDQGRKYETFDLRMEQEAVGLLWDKDRVSGVVVQTPQGQKEIHADLVIGCDGRHSMTRSAAGFEVLELGVPIDVLWFRIGRHSNDPEQVLGTINYGHALILINRGSYFQAGLIIKKGSFDKLQLEGLAAFRDSITRIAPFLADRVEELQDWDQVKLLSIQINRLKHWHRPGLLCIGDAAHAMSPAFGVGINLAIQDAVATANLLVGPLRRGEPVDDLLRKVQRRREFPTRVTQLLQRFAHKGLSFVFQQQGSFHAPWQLRAAVRIPALQRTLARVVGVGVLPEHVHLEGAQKPFTRTRLTKTACVLAGVTAAFTVAWLNLRRR